MKSEHRHDLKTNELADWVEHFPQWFKNNQKNLLYGLLIVCVALGVWFFIAQQKSNARKADEKFYSLIKSSDRAKSILMRGFYEGQDLPVMKEYKSSLASYENSNNIRQASLAMIKIGDILRMEIHYHADAVTSKFLDEQITTAKEYYNKAIAKLTSKGGENSILQYGQLYAAAKLGLAMCEEDLGNFDEAKKIYESLVERKEFDFTPAYADAKQRLVLNDYLKTKVKFLPSPTEKSYTIPIESLGAGTMEEMKEKLEAQGLVVETEKVESDTESNVIKVEPATEPNK